MRDANFVEIENQFRYTALYVVIQILNCSLGKRSEYLQALLFMWGTSCLDHLTRMLRNE
jgi:hypothetical protein